MPNSSKLFPQSSEEERANLQTPDNRRTSRSIRPISAIFVLMGGYCVGLGLTLTRFIDLHVSMKGVDGVIFPFFPDILDFVGLLLIGLFMLVYGIRLNLKK